MYDPGPRNVQDTTAGQLWGSQTKVARRYERPSDTLTQLFLAVILSVAF